MTSKSHILVPVPFQDRNVTRSLISARQLEEYAAQLGGAKRIFYQGQTAEGHVYWPDGYKPPVAMPAPAPAPAPALSRLRCLILRQSPRPLRPRQCWLSN